MTSLVRESERRRLLERAQPKTLVHDPLARVNASRPDPAAAWPATVGWSHRQRKFTALRFRSLGLGGIRSKKTAGRVSASPVFSVLGEDSFAQFAAINVPGQVIWCNFDLARQLGFEVPRSNQLSPDLNAQLLAALSLRAVAPAQVYQSPETVTMYADRYGGEGVQPALGAGRAGFLEFGNLYLKGVGLTPLFRHDNEDDFAHSHGGVHLDDCLTEAVFGEVNQNLFAQKSARVLAIIDQGKHVTAPSGQRIPVGLVVRAGAQLRPGHLLGSHWRRQGSRLDKFVSITRATGQLVTRPSPRSGRDVPDVAATTLRIIDDHARTAAESFRWRMMHGALTASNMEMSGAMLDLPTQSTQPRTAPIRILDHGDAVFGREHVERAVQLTPMYRALVRHTSPAERVRLNVRWMNLAARMERAYRRHLQVKLLSAAGLKTEVAERIQLERTELAVGLTDLILRMVDLQNPGTTRAWKSTVESVSVLDVFRLLQRLPETYFANPSANHGRKIRSYLRPIFRGNRLHIAKKRRLVSSLVVEFAGFYGQLMESCADYAAEFYGGVPGMQASIKARAAFENQPLDALYAKKLLAEFAGTIAAYKTTGDPELVRAAIDQRITASLRSVDGLLAQGSSVRLPRGGIELERRIIDGVAYSVRAWDDGAQTRRLHVSIPVEREGSCYLSAVPGLPRLREQQLKMLRYRFTTDGWKTSGYARARWQPGRSDFTVDFEVIASFPIVGCLEGAFYLRQSGAFPRKSGARVAPYVFAIPDRQELGKLRRQFAI